MANTGFKCGRLKQILQRGAGYVSDKPEEERYFEWVSKW